MDIEKYIGKPARLRKLELLLIPDVKEKLSKTPKGHPDHQYWVNRLDEYMVEREEWYYHIKKQL